MPNVCRPKGLQGLGPTISKQIVDFGNHFAYKRYSSAVKIKAKIAVCFFQIYEIKKIQVLREP